LQQSRDQEQGDHGDGGAKVRQGEFRQQRDRASAREAEVAADADESIEGHVDDRTRIEAVSFERVLGLALGALSGAMQVGRGGQFGEVELHGARE
jgi:hypothetical protein